MYKLFYSPFMCSIAPHIVLEEIGQPYTVQLAPFKMENKAEYITDQEYLTVNPKGRVPALIIEGRVLTEAPAILMYLARKHPEANLVPKDPEAEARCYEWLAFLSTSIHATALSQISRPQRFVSDEADYPKVVEKGQKALQAGFDYVERQVQGREWAVPGQYTFADPYLLFFYLVASKLSPVPVREAFPAWTKIADKVMERPAVQRVMQEETKAAA